MTAAAARRSSPATLVFVHAHPDDEASSTGGTIARAAADGHRTIVVLCTNGEHGSTPDDLAAGETLVARRRAETERSAEILGVDRLIWLGYVDSGMSGWDQNHAECSFWSTPVEVAAARLVDQLGDERVDLGVTYDDHGGYGHPDHVQAYRVGRRAAEQLGVRRLESTFNRDEWRRQIDAFRALDPDNVGDFDPEVGDDGNPVGTAEADISLAVDVAPWIDQKRAALAAHASQVDDAGRMAALPPDVFARAFRTEWYREPGRSGPPRAGWVLEER